MSTISMLHSKPLISESEMILTEPIVSRGEDTFLNDAIIKNNGSGKSHINVRNLNVYIKKNHILKNVNLELPDKAITCIIGPSGCGKTTLLKTFNRLLEQSLDVKIDGEVLVDGENIHGKKVDVISIRKKM